jgi:hypothetical protein
MSLTKRQIDKAGRLYGLAMAALADSGGTESEAEMAVMDRSRGTPRIRSVAARKDWRLH